MTKLRPIRKWIVVDTKLGGEKTSAAGIIYTEKVTTKLVWGKVLSCGAAITEDIRVGDAVLWDLTKSGGHVYNAKYVVHQDWIVATQRN